MKRSKIFVSSVLILLVLFSGIKQAYLASDTNSQVYAAKNGMLLAADSGEGTGYPATDAECVQADYYWLEPYRLNIYSSFLDLVKENLNLPTTGQYGSSISWSSSDTAVIDTDGTVTRPPYTQGHENVTLTAVFSKGA